MMAGAGTGPLPYKEFSRGVVIGVTNVGTLGFLGNSKAPWVVIRVVLVAGTVGLTAYTLARGGVREVGGGGWYSEGVVVGGAYVVVEGFST